MFKDDYRSALSKITPSEAWKKDTLEKMLALEKEQGQAKYGKANDRAIPFTPKKASALKKLRRAALPVAAVLAFAIIPMTTLRGCGSAGGSAEPPMISQKNASADCAPYESYTQDETQENEGSGHDSVRSPAGAAPTDTDADGTITVERSAALSSVYGSALNKSVERSEPVTSGDLTVTIAPGSVKFNYDTEVSGGGFALIVRTEDADELCGRNPTLDLSSEEMPAALPVYQVALDSGEMYDTLKDTADILGATLVEDKEGFSAEVISRDDLDAGVPWRVPVAFASTEDETSMSYTADIVHYYSVSDSGALMEAPEDETDVQSYYYENYGAKLQPMENPVLEITGNYSFYGDFHTNEMIFEAGEPDDTIETQLYNYTFKNIRLGTQADTNALHVVSYTVPPEEIGVCALRSLDEATQALRNGEAWQGMRQGGYDGGKVNILHWELCYESSPLMDTIQPVYRFLVDMQDEEYDVVPHMQVSGSTESFRTVTYLTVPALLPEYLTDMEYVQSD